jgi:hypothetical protein
VVDRSNSRINSAARDLLRTYLQLSNGEQSLSHIIKNFMFNGRRGQWSYHQDLHSGTSITKWEKEANALPELNVGFSVPL